MNDCARACACQLVGGALLRGLQRARNRPGAVVHGVQMSRPPLRIARRGSFLLLLLLGAQALAGPRCATPCKEETARCRQTRCAGLDGKARRDCVETCRGIGGCARIRTLAYVVSECGTSSPVARQSLHIRRGNCAPVSVMELVSSVLPDRREEFAGACRLFGDFRRGSNSRFVGFIHRLSVTPDGSGVVFEVTDAVDRLFDFPDSVERGFYFVRADGRRLRRIGPASEVTLVGFDRMGNRVGPPPYPQSDISSDGKTIVYTDLGPGPAGEPAVQVVTLEIATGRRRPLTSFPALPPDSGLAWATVAGPRFVDHDTILFQSLLGPDGSPPEGAVFFFTVQTDGTQLRRVGPSAAPGGRIDPVFVIAGGGTNLFNWTFFGPDGQMVFQEVFLLDGRRLLQLTRLRSPQTSRRLLSPGGRRAVFVSEDTAGRCQLFSVDTLGNHLRQLTRFGVGEPTADVCRSPDWWPPACSILETFQDPATRTVVFGYTCDPLGGTTNGGQVFAMRPDGTGLRQLTSTRGSVAAGGEVTVELPGPISYSGRWK